MQKTKNKQKHIYEKFGCEASHLTSDGEVFEYLKYLGKSERKLSDFNRSYQEEMSLIQ